jgi:hypothetical protein
MKCGEIWIEETTLQAIDRLIERGQLTRHVPTPRYDFALAGAKSALHLRARWESPMLTNIPPQRNGLFDIHSRNHTRKSGYARASDRSLSCCTPPVHSPAPNS